MEKLRARSTLHLEASLLADGAALATPVLESRGWYDQKLGRGLFLHRLVLQETDGATRVTIAAWHDRSRIGIAVDDGPKGGPDPWRVATATALASGKTAGPAELSRVGRYQPHVAMLLLDGLDGGHGDAEPSGPGPQEASSVRVDLDAAIASQPPERQGWFAESLEPFANRELQGWVRCDGAGSIQSVEYLLPVPSGAGDIGHWAIWTVSVRTPLFPSPDWPR